MELMSLLAKLTLDKQEYDKGLKEAENDAKGLKIDTPKIPKPDNTDFDAGLKEAEETGNLFKEVMTGVWQGVKDAIVVTGITSAVMGVVGAMRQGIDMAIETGDAIDKGAKNLGISTKAYQEYEYALGKSGLKVKDLSKTMDGLGKILSGDLTDKQKKYVDELKEMGFVADEAAGNEKNLASMMKALADYQGTDKGAIIDWLFGSNLNWNGFFDQTSSDIDGLKKKAADMGMIMPDEAIQNAVEFKDTTEEINNRIEAMKRSFGESILPALKDISKTMLEIMNWFSGGDKSLDETFTDINKQTEAAKQNLEATSSTATAMIDKLSSMGDYWTLDERGQKTWNALADEFIATYPQFAEFIDKENKVINGNTEEIKENIRQWTLREKQRLVDENVAAKREAVAKQYADALDKEVEAEVKEAEASGKRADALKEINDALKAAGMKELGENATTQEMRDAKTALRIAAGDDTTQMQRVNELGSAYLTTLGEAEKLRNEANNLYADADEAQANLEAYSAKLAEKMGLSAEQTDAETEKVNALGSAVNNLPDSKIIHIGVETDTGFTGYTKAIGDGYIPFDNYPALLHRGERVLTATENRKGEGSGTDLSHLEERIAAAIRAGMEGVSVNSYLNGRNVTAEVNRNNMRDVKGRRFSR